MSNLTEEQIKEIRLLIAYKQDLILEGVEGIAKVAKAIQLYLNVSFCNAIEVLNNNLQQGFALNIK